MRRALIVCFAPLIAACSQKQADATPLPTASTDKVPITSASDQARQYYLQGRTLAELLRAHDSRALFEQAVAADPAFAMAHVALAQSAATAKDFFEHVNAAVALKDKVSEGERLTILTLQAGANADPTKARQYAEELVSKFPQDERARMTLGTQYFAQQQNDLAIEQLRKAIDINPAFSPAYNMLGYSYRAVGQNTEAETAFKKYIALVPNDPNPYDSYAEFLMKMGRFDESIAQYQKALANDPHFISSRLGIAADHVYLGQHDAALAEAEKMFAEGRDDGEKRTALFWEALIYSDEGKTNGALHAMQREYDIGARAGDTAAISADALAMGNILLIGGQPDEARKKFAQSLDLILASSQSNDVKEDTKLAGHYNAGRVALARNDLATARTEAAAYLSGAQARHNDVRILQAHELEGAVGVRSAQFDAAIAELGQASQQDPYAIYETALAYQGKGDAPKARELARQAAEANILPTLNYVSIRTKAKQME